MRKERSLLVLAALALVAAAAGSGVIWQEDFAKASSEAAKNGELIFVVFGGNAAKPLCAQLEGDFAFKSLAGEYIFVRSAATGSAAAKALGLVAAAPGTIAAAIVAPDGKALVVYETAPEPSKVSAEMKVRLGEVYLKRASEAVASADDALAVGLLRKVASLGASQDMDAAQRLLVEAGDRGIAKVAAVEKLISDKSYLEAKRALDKLAQDYAGTAAERAAADRRAKLMANPVAGQAIKEQERLEAANDMLKLARQFEAEEKTVDAMGLYGRVVREYPGTDAAKQAAEASSRLKRGTIKTEASSTTSNVDRDCRLWMSTADNFAAQGKQTAAMQVYQKIIDTYPNSSYAATAKEKLAKLQ